MARTAAEIFSERKKKREQTYVVDPTVTVARKDNTVTFEETAQDIFRRRSGESPLLTRPSKPDLSKNLFDDTFEKSHAVVEQENKARAERNASVKSEAVQDFLKNNPGWYVNKDLTSVVSADDKSAKGLSIIEDEYNHKKNYKNNWEFGTGDQRIESKIYPTGQKQPAPSHIDMSREYNPYDKGFLNTGLFSDRTKLKWDIGKLRDDEGKLWSKASQTGKKEDYDAAMKVSTQIDSIYEEYPEMLTDMDYNKANALSRIGGFLRSGVEGTAEMLPTMIGAGLEGAKYGFPAGTAAGGAFLIGGQAGPQIALPEELGTVPVAFATAYKVASAFGSGTYMYNVEKGHSFKAMIDSGVPADVANRWSTVVGALNAGLELVQLNELLKGAKVAGNLSDDLANEGLKKFLSTKGVETAKQYGVSVGKETGQEVAQEIVGIAGETAAKKESGQEAYFFTNENVDRLAETAISSLKSFAVLHGAGQVGGAAFNTASKQSKKAIQSVVNRVRSNPELMNDEKVRKEVQTLLEEVKNTNETINDPVLAEAEQKLVQIQTDYSKSAQISSVLNESTNEDKQVNDTQENSQEIKPVNVDTSNEQSVSLQDEIDNERNFVNTSRFGEVEVIDNDGALVTIKNKSGTELKVGVVAFEKMVQEADQMNVDKVETPAEIPTVKAKEKSEIKAKIDSDRVKIKDEVTSVHNGQTDSIMRAEYDGEEVGSIEYSVYDDKAYINMINVPEKYKRNGIATRMLRQLQSQNPDVEIEWGVTTPEGTALRESVTYTVENPKTAPLFKEYEQVTKELDKINQNIENGIISDEEGERWNELNDRQQFLENELRNKSPEQRFIKSDKKTEVNSEKKPKSFKDNIKKYKEMQSFVESEGYILGPILPDMKRSSVLSKEIDETGNQKVVGYISPDDSKITFYDRTSTETETKQPAKENRGFTPLTESKNNKTGEKIFEFEPVEKLPVDEWKALLNKIRKLGGNYYKGKFYFKSDSLSDAQSKFEQLFSGETVKAVDKPKSDSKPVDKPEPVDKSKQNAEKLRKVADSMQSTIDNKMGDKLSNTARRATMAANSYAEGESLMRLQNIIRAIADDIENGTAKRAIANISSRAEVETIDVIMRMASYEYRDAKVKEKYGKNSTDQMRRSIPIESDIAQVPRYGRMPSVNSEYLQRYLRDFENKPGFKRDISKAVKFVGKTREYLHTNANLVTLLEKTFKEDSSSNQLKDEVARYKRLVKLGVTTEDGLEYLMKDYLKYYKITSDNTAQKKEREIKMREQELARMKIEGFFPTPKKIVNQMIELADIKKGEKVLEPSAGAGSIADEIGVGKVDVVEYSMSLNQLLKEKGHNVVGDDIFNAKGQYDKVVMNPPFEKGQDIDHVRHVYDNLLKPNGRIVAIMSEGPFFRNDKKATEFREWLDGVGYSEKLPDGAFKESDRSTGVATRIVVIDKPAEAKVSKTAKESLTMEERNFDDLGSRSVKAYQFENPEVKPYFKSIAEELLTDVNNTTKGEKFFTETENELVITGVPRITSPLVADIKDSTGATYDQIKDALNRLIKDNGQENLALAKRIEVVIDEALVQGYKTFDGLEIPPNKGYIQVRNKIEDTKIKIPEYEPKNMDSQLNEQLTLGPLSEGENYSMFDAQKQSDLDEFLDFVDSKQKKPKAWVNNYEAWSSENRINEYKSESKGKIKPVHEIMNDIKRNFKVGVTTSRFRSRKAYAHYKVFPQVIESKIANTIEPLMHELGHHFDHKYGLKQNEVLIKEMIAKMPEEFTKLYKPEDLSGESIAEFVRLYMTSPADAKEYAGDFYQVFEKSLESSGDLKKLQNTRNDVLNWLAAATKEQVNSVIVSRLGKSKLSELKKDFKGNVQALGKKTYMYLFDELQPLVDFVEYVEKTTGQKIPSTSNAYLLAQQSLKAPVIARTITTEALLNPKNEVIGDSFKSIFKDLDVKNYDDFTNYLIGKRAIDYWERGKRAFSDDLPIEYIQSMIEAYESEKPEFVEMANNLYAWWQAFTNEWIVKTGLLEAGVYKHMTELEPHYVPFFRLRNEQMVIGDAVMQLSRRGYVDHRNPIKRSSMKGSADPIFDPIESMIMEIERYVTTVKRREVMLSIHEIYTELGEATNALRKNVLENGLGYIINKVNPRMSPDKVDMVDKKLKLALSLYDEFAKTMTVGEKIEYEALKFEIENGNGTFEELLDFFHKKGYNAMEVVNELIDDTEMEFKPMEFDKEKNIITVKDRNGKTVHYEVYDKFLLEALLNTDNSNIDSVTRYVAAFRRIMQALITTFDPVFFTRNFTRDIQQGFVASDIPMQKYHAAVIKAIYQEITNGEWSKSYKRTGGGFASPTGASRNALKESMGEVIPGWKRKHPLETILQTVEKISDAVEQAPRIAEYRYFIEQNGDTFDNRLEALFKAQDVTVNFNRKGQVMRRWYGNFIPFLNPALQGIDKVLRMNTKEIAKTLPRALIGITLTSLVFYALNYDDDEYKKVNKYIKDTYYLFPTGTKGKYIRIPKPREISMLYGSSFERALDMAVKKDPDAWEGYFKNLLDSFMPPIEPITKGISDAANNKTWYDGEIVPYSYQDLEKDQQYDDRTSWFSKQLAKIIPDSSNFSSPMVLDYLIGQYTGVIGKYAIPATDSIKGNTFEHAVTSFTTDIAYSNNVVPKFYDRMREMESAIATAKAGRPVKGYKGINAKPVFDSINNEIKDIRKLHDAIDKISDTEFESVKSDVSKKLGVEMNKMSKEQFKRALKLEIVRRAEYANKVYDEESKKLEDYMNK